MPSSRAISAIGRPLLPTSSTASRLNSAVNWRRVLGCLSSMRTSSAQGRCPASGGKSNPAAGWVVGGGGEHAGAAGVERRHPGEVADDGNGLLAQPPEQQLLDLGGCGTVEVA